jgi:hypothetical protein
MKYRVVGGFVYAKKIYAKIKRMSCKWNGHPGSKDQDVKNMWMQQCVAHEIKTHNSGKMCEVHKGLYAYAAGKSKCSMHDLHKHCHEISKKFTIDHATSLCSAKYDAEKSWWKKNWKL